MLCFPLVDDLAFSQNIQTTELTDKELMNKPLTNIEKDRVKVLLLSFLIVVVFWGAFEQAG